MKCKKTIDARSYSHQALEEIRISVVHLAVAGESPDAVDTLFRDNHFPVFLHKHIVSRLIALLQCAPAAFVPVFLPYAILVL